MAKKPAKRPAPKATPVVEDAVEVVEEIIEAPVEEAVEVVESAPAKSSSAEYSSRFNYYYKNQGLKEVIKWEFYA